MSTQVEEEKKQEVNKEPEIKSNWTTKERQECLQEYGCEIIIDNGSYEDVRTKKAPTDASIVKYQHNDKECFDLTRGPKIRLFEMYWDKYKTGLRKIEWVHGTVSPTQWGYKKPEKKRRRKG